ncbi:MAG TPA: hypothetical protein VGR10_02850 [Thermoleophilaceae bacterium]|nr:hypothetical protein [Thermoleophilaceae bacterium]
MRRPRRPAQDLRFTVDCLPRRTRVAMLQGLESNTIIVGAYTDRDGGICPMLAAHRGGGRTDLSSFARAWDRYTRAGNRARRASDRELRTLRTMLEASLARDESASGELARAVAELEEIKARRAREQQDTTFEAERDEGAAAEPAPGPMAPPEPRVTAPERPDTGERDRSGELGPLSGWAWLRVFRRYDDYQAALERVRRAEREAERRELEPV